MIPSIFALSQDGWEWAPVGAQWHYEMHGGEQSKMIVVGDTIINSQNCKILEYHGMFLDCDGVDDRRTFMYFENKKIYWLFNNAFELVYDFNLKEGGIVDWFPFDLENDELFCTGLRHTVDSAYTQTANGIDFQEYEMSNFPGFYFPLFHELFLSSVNPLPTELLLDNGFYVTLQCYSDDRFTVNMDYSGTDPVAIFTDKCDFIVATDDLEEENLRPKIFPTMTRDYVEIDSRTPIKEYILYSVSGEFIDYQEFDSKTGNTSIDISLLSSGVYFLRLIDSEGRQFIEKIMKL